MNLIKELQKDLDSGFTKSDLERCIGLPKNSLSGIMAGSRNISKKSKLKIEHFLNNSKPNPLELVFNKPEKKSENTEKQKVDISKHKTENLDNSQENTLKHDEIDVKIFKPKNLLDLRKLMPPNLTPEEKAIWTENNRKKYNL
jgi:plasmid maintenance system antidote protein VapI